MIENQADSFSFPPTIEPFYRSREPGKEIRLYEGPLSFEDDDSNLLTGVAFLQWLPTPRIGYRAWSLEAAPPQALELLLEPGSDREDPNLLSLDHRWLRKSSRGPKRFPKEAKHREEGWFSSSIQLGEVGPVESVRFNLINFNNLMGSSFTSVGSRERGWRRNRLTLVAEGWRLEIDSLEQSFGFLRQTGAFAFTHVAELRRQDGSTFEWHGGLEDCLLHFFMLARGQRVGIALPVGCDVRNKPTWALWRATIADRWREGFTWADPNTPQAIENLFPSFYALWQDEFWRTTIRRAIQYYVEGNRTDPVDTSIIMVQAGLELLAWAVLVEDLNWTPANKKDEKPSGRIRRLLEWASVPSDIPASLPNLASWAAGRKGPHALTDIRNLLTHPKRHESRPPDLAMTEAWLLGSFWLELLLLRVCGFKGQFGNRLVRDRRAGSVEDLPWMKAQSRTD